MRAPLNLLNITEAVGQHLHLTLGEIMRGGRQAPPVYARQLCWYLASYHGHYTVGEIAAYFKRHRGTIHPGIRKIISLRASDIRVSHDLSVLERRVKPAWNAVDFWREINEQVEAKLDDMTIYPPITLLSYKVEALDAHGVTVTIEVPVTVTEQ